MGSLPIRIKLDLTRLDNIKYSYVWFPIDRRRFITINDVKTDICKKYELPEDRTELFLKGALLREDETVLLLRENDTVQVLYKQLELESSSPVTKCGVWQCAGNGKKRKTSLQPSVCDSKDCEVSNNVYGLLYAGGLPSSGEEICSKRKKKKYSSDVRYNLDIGRVGNCGDAEKSEFAAADSNVHAAVPDVTRKDKKKKKKKCKEKADRTEKMQVVSSFDCSTHVPGSSNSRVTHDSSFSSNAVSVPNDEDLFASNVTDCQNTEHVTEKLRRKKKRSTENLNRAETAAETLSTIEDVLKYISERQQPYHPHMYGMLTYDDVKSVVECSRCHCAGDGATASVPHNSKEDRKKNPNKSTGVAELVLSHLEDPACEPSSRNSLNPTGIDPCTFLMDGGGHKNKREKPKIGSCAGAEILADADGFASGIIDLHKETTKIHSDQTEMKSLTSQDLHVSTEGEQCFPMDRRDNKDANSSIKVLNSSSGSGEVSVDDVAGASLDVSLQSVPNGDEESTLANSGNCRKKKRRRRRKRRTRGSSQNVEPTVLYARNIGNPVEKAIVSEPEVKQGTGMHIRFSDVHDDNGGPGNSGLVIELGTVQPQKDASSKSAVNQITPPQDTRTEASKIVAEPQLVLTNTIISGCEALPLKDPEPVNMLNGVSNKLEESGQKDYSAYPPLNTMPEVGAVIAFQLLELSDIYCPELTDYKEGRVLSVDQSDDVISIELLAEEVKKPKSGKFENVYSSDSEVDVEILKVISRKFNELVHPKIVIPAASV